MTSHLYLVVMNRIKALLKERKISYAKLSRLTQTPVSTLKKWFAAQDGSLNRVDILCTSLGLSLVQILRSLERMDVQTLEMNPKQQQYFLEDPVAFSIYWHLLYERMHAEEVRLRLQLDPKAYRQKLLRMDRLNLLEVSIHEKVVVTKIQPVRWRWAGPFLEKTLRQWSHATAEDSFSRDKNFILQFFQMSAESGEELRRDLKALEEKYARRTNHELAIGGIQIQKTRFLACLADGSFFPKAKTTAK